MFDLGSRPALKRAYNASMIDENQILVGVTPESAAILEIQEPWMAALLVMLDGSKSVLGLVSALKEQGFSVPAEKILFEIENMVEAGIIEDAKDYESALESGTLSSYESIRYDRQLLLFQAITGNYPTAFSHQKKLRESKVALHGLGGVGSYAFYALAAMGIGYLRVADFDSVELTNLSRQILYEEDDIGKQKIDVAKAKAPKINSTIEYDFQDRMITTLDQVVSFLEGMDFAIVAADVPRDQLRRIYNEASHITGVPYLFAASAHTWVTCGPMIIPGKTPCYECCLPEPLRHDHPIVEFIRSRYTTALIDPYNSMAASLGVLEAVKYLTGFQPSRVEGSTLLLNTETFETHLVPGKRKEGCKFCSSLVGEYEKQNSR